MLNAFRHHRGGHADDVDRDRPATQCAQRLSASQRWASRCAIDRAPMIAECSTPFGITEVGIAPMPSASPSDRSECSTPFGITEVGTRLGPVDACRVVRCSTPFGITEVARRTTAVARPADRCAQRLSASQRWARRCSRRAVAAVDVCSTPFGITEVGIAPFQTPSIKQLAQRGFQGRCRKPAKSGRAWACPTQAHGSILPGNGSYGESWIFRIAKEPEVQSP